MSRKLLIILMLLFTSAGAQVADNSVQDKIYKARDKVMPALVHIQPVIKDYNTGELKKQAVIGSGVIFHPDGYVVTNYHVAGKAVRIICTLNDKEQVPAEYVGGDPATDIAVVKLNLDDYKGKIQIAEFGNSDEVQVGQYVMAMGSPLSLSRTVSFGVISTKDRYFSSDVRLPTGESTGRYNLWIQTDAAINPGNSGGPLIDLDGRVIGINSRATMFANNIGFAIPINIVKEVTSAILNVSEVHRSWIGLHCQALQELENYFRTGNNEGVLISSIDPGSPAEASFLKAGDIILEVDGVPVSARFVEELPAFYSKIARHEPGSEIRLKVMRNNEEYNFKVVTKPLGELQGEDFECGAWGFTVKGLTRHMRLQYQLKDTLGVFVSGVKSVSPADIGGLRRSDVVVKVNKTDIVELADFINLYNEMSSTSADKILLTIKRGGGTRLVFLSIDNKEGVLFNEE
ncbi:MAG: trypsin-like peptidase domain-containing protein [candidate division Zixibacteria bacterium]|nr:trypsin-like peptidase domain-containing protein [candidate division Zixibacteria bacterium]